MNIYAYTPDENGKEPLGTHLRIISKNEYKSVNTFIRYRLKPYHKDYYKFKIYSFSNFYDESTYRLLKEPHTY